MKYEKCGQEIKEINKTIKIPELKIEIETKIYYRGKTYAECLEDCPKGWQIVTYEILQWLRNNDKYRDKLNLLDTWEFVQNPDKISKNNNAVAGFYAYSNGAFLSCGRNPGDSDRALGVRYFRKLK